MVEQGQAGAGEHVAIHGERGLGRVGLRGQVKAAVEGIEGDVIVAGPARQGAGAAEIQPAAVVAQPLAGLRTQTGAIGGQIDEGPVPLAAGAGAAGTVNGQGQAGAAFGHPGPVQRWQLVLAAAGRPPEGQWRRVAIAEVIAG